MSFYLLHLRRSNFYSRSFIFFFCAFVILFVVLVLRTDSSSPRLIKTVEYSFGNSGTTTIASGTDVYAADNGIGTQTAWTVTAPSQASQGFTVRLNGTNIRVKTAWIEFRAVTVSLTTSLSDIAIGVSTCPGSVSSCASAPTYRDTQLLGTPTTIFYFVQSGENNVIYAKADATGAFEGLSDSQWATGVETLVRVRATGPTLTNHTAKLHITYESDYNPSPHYEVKTVRFPLRATSTGDMGTRAASLGAGVSQAFSYNAHIPDLSSTADILDVHFELSGQASAATVGTYSARVGTGSTSPSFIANSSTGAATHEVFALYRPPIDGTNFQPNTNQFLHITPATNPLFIAGGELVVTYRAMTDATVQTETVRFMVGQTTTSGSTASSTFIINPSIANTGLSVKHVYIRAQAPNTAAATLHVRADIDHTGSAPARTNSYALSFTATEQVGSTRIIHDISNDAASFVSGGPLLVESRWSNTSGDPVSLELFVTFTWSGHLGGTQTKTVEYFVPNSKFGGTAAAGVDVQRTYVMDLSFPEPYTKTLRSAYVEAAIVSSQITSPINLNMGFNADALSPTGSGSLSYANTGEAMSFIALADASTAINVTQSSQKPFFSIITGIAHAHSLKTIVTYEVALSAIATILVDTVGIQMTPIQAPTSTAYLGGVFRILNNATSSQNITSIKISATGTVDIQNAIQNVRLYYDVDTLDPPTCNDHSFALSDSAFGTTTALFDSGYQALFTDSVSLPGLGALCVYVVIDVLSSAGNGTTFDIFIQNPSSDILASASVAPATPVHVSGATEFIKSIVTLARYHWRTGLGNELNATSATNGIENIPLPIHSKNSVTRIRMAIANAGSSSSPSMSYRLEWARKDSSCASTSSWTRVDASGDAWEMASIVNITDGANATNIALAIGGVSDPYATFVTANGGLKDDTDTINPLVLDPNSFIEAEYIIRPTSLALQNTTYCFRVTAGGVPIDAYTVYPEITVKYDTDFKIQRGVATMTGTTLTLTAGADYEAPASSTRAFIRITNTQHTGAGPNTTGTFNANVITAYISNPSDIGTGVTLMRTAATANTRVYWEIVEYVGPPGGDNEIIVRRQESLSYATTSLTATSSVITSVTNWNKVVPFITGQHNRSATTSTYNYGLSTADYSSTTNTVILTRSASGAVADTSYAVVEFRGSNWNIQRVSHTFSSTTITETKSIQPVNSLSRAFLHTQKRVAGTNVNHADIGHEVWLSSIGIVSFRLDPQTAVAANNISVAWVIENTQTSGNPMIVTRSNGLLETAGGANELNVISVGKTLPDTSIVSLFVNNRSNEAVRTWPEPILGVRLRSSSEYELWRGNPSADVNYRTEVVEWPTAETKLSQNYYRLYVNNGLLTPNDPWPVGAINLGENAEITRSDEPLSPGDTIRVRMTLAVSGSRLNAGFGQFKLQYGTRVSTCAAIPNGSWTDVGDIDDVSAHWRGTTSPVTSGTPLGANPPGPGELLISISSVAGTFENRGYSTTTPYTAEIGDNIEFDWLIERASATPKASYCFRMVTYNGQTLSAYHYYPTIRTTGYGAETQHWKWYDDAEEETPLVALAATSTAPIDITYDNILQLRVTVKEMNGASGINVKFKLQFSERSDFNSVFDVAEIGTCTATSVWCYADGGGIDGQTITTRTLGDAQTCISGVGSGCGSHNESGASLATTTHFAYAATEFAFTIRNAGARPNRVYYFRLFDIQLNEPVIARDGYSYPSLVSEGAQLTFSVSGVPAGTTIAGVITDISTTPTSIAFGTLPLDTPIAAAYRVTVDTNGTEGYKLYMVAPHDLMTSGGSVILPVTGTNLIPTSWTIGCPASAPSCFGYHTTDDTLENGSARFAPLDTFARVSTTTLDEVAYSAQPVTGESTDILFKLLVRQLQDAGLYETNMWYVSVPIF